MAVFYRRSSAARLGRVSLLLSRPDWGNVADYTGSVLYHQRGGIWHSPIHPRLPVINEAAGGRRVGKRGVANPRPRSHRRTNSRCDRPMANGAGTSRENCRSSAANRRTDGGGSERLWRVNGGDERP